MGNPVEKMSVENFYEGLLDLQRDTRLLQLNALEVPETRSGWATHTCGDKLAEAQVKLNEAIEALLGRLLAWRLHNGSVVPGVGYLPRQGKEARANEIFQHIRRGDVEIPPPLEGQIASTTPFTAADIEEAQDRSQIDLRDAAFHVAAATGRSVMDAAKFLAESTPKVADQVMQAAISLAKHSPFDISSIGATEASQSEPVAIESESPAETISAATAGKIASITAEALTALDECPGNVTRFNQEITLAEAVGETRAPAPVPPPAYAPEETFPHRLRRLRLQARLSCGELAWMAGGIKEATVNDWECGLAAPPSPTFRPLLASALGVSVGYLMTGIVSKPLNVEPPPAGQCNGETHDSCDQSFECDHPNGPVPEPPATAPTSPEPIQWPLHCYDCGRGMNANGSATVVDGDEERVVCGLCEKNYQTPSPAETREQRRGPGRPKKAAGEQSAAPKRGPGRPRKSHEGDREQPQVQAQQTEGPQEPERQTTEADGPTLMERYAADNLTSPPPETVTSIVGGRITQIVVPNSGDSSAPLEGVDRHLARVAGYFGGDDETETEDASPAPPPATTESQDGFLDDFTF